MRSAPPTGSGRPGDKEVSRFSKDSTITDLWSLRDDAESFARLRKLVARKTFVGIDFGTSTTVASLIEIDEETCSIVANPIPIVQFDVYGRRIEGHLVPSCLAWRDDQLLVGTGASYLRAVHTPGKDVWTSFKMELGVDLGPTYFKTLLKEGGPGPTVQRPQDATREFLRYIRVGIEEAVASRGLPDEIHYAVSVPASFEANQRRDLMNALASAGFSFDSSGLIDEPNAAFLSFLFYQESADFRAFIKTEVQRVLVFDFGAGTCDISILEVDAPDGAIRSKNRSVSKFFALGGNDIDRAIAEKILLPQLLAPVRERIELTTDQTNQVLHRLMPVAEFLKIQCCKMLRTRGISSLEAARDRAQQFTENAIPRFTISGVSLSLDRPKISMASFADIMAPFLTDTADQDTEKGRGPPSIFEPIDNALLKAELEPDDLHHVLFIGGGSENTLVQEAIKSRFGRFVEAIVPADLRTHVSQGAALHALSFYGFGVDMIQPITSEPVVIVTVGGDLQEILSAGTSVPSPEIHVSRLKVQHDGQKRVELPICVSNENKMLGVISIESASPEGFREEDAVQVSCSLTRDKLLKVTVRLDGQKVESALMNPLANRELTPNELAMLKARQRFNASVLQGNGRPEVASVVALAEAAAQAKEYVIAAEMYETAERLDGGDFATNICYCWSKAKRIKDSERWSKTAFERKPDSVSAYNLALDLKRKDDIEGFRRLIRKSLQLDAGNTGALLVYGDYLLASGDPSGADYLERCAGLLAAELDAGTIDEDDCNRLERAAKRLGRNDLREKARNRRVFLSRLERPYEDDNLVSGHAAPLPRKRR